ncbi:hypothetical protein B0J11DRAFT_594667 [Dendryphion nanum]|uniref:Uncharacterized protein n=1 Tax=Dendryphion nanum TaxID=256645 RepID=A0A9P9D7V3_9PLEO|nr:hypothetical protein B0J11DRAFT_594667 [Dendryphion nanum]
MRHLNFLVGFMLAVAVSALSIDTTLGKSVRGVRCGECVEAIGHCVNEFGCNRNECFQTICREWNQSCLNCYSLTTDFPLCLAREEKDDRDEHSEDVMAHLNCCTCRAAIEMGRCEVKGQGASWFCFYCNSMLDRCGCKNVGSRGAEPVEAPSVRGNCDADPASEQSPEGSGGKKCQLCMKPEFKCTLCPIVLSSCYEYVIRAKNMNWVPALAVCMPNTSNAGSDDTSVSMQTVYCIKGKSRCRHSCEMAQNSGK